MKLLRDLFRFDHTKPASDVEVFKQFSTPELLIYMRMLRLRYLGRLFEHDLNSLKSLIAKIEMLSKSWPGLSKADFDWVAKHRPDFRFLSSVDWHRVEAVELITSCTWNEIIDTIIEDTHDSPFPKPSQSPVMLEKSIVVSAT